MPSQWEPEALVFTDFGQLARISSVADAAPHMHSSVFVADCTWELFVLVCKDARGRRQDIRTALIVAEVSVPHSVLFTSPMPSIARGTTAVAETPFQATGARRCPPFPPSIGVAIPLA